MPFGLALSFMFHAALLGWALFSMRSVTELTPDTPAISAELISPSEFLRLKQGSEDAKHLDTKAEDQPTPDDSKNDTKKPDNAPPPPPAPSEQEVAEVEPPPEPEPPKPETVPGPTADEKKLLEEKIEEERRADEAKKSEAEAKQKAQAEAALKAEEEAKEKAEEQAKQAAEEAKKKAEEEAKKKAQEEARKKAEAEAKRKAAAKKKTAELKKKKEAARKKAEAAKKQFDPSRIASLLEKSPDDAKPKALLDKDPRKKGQRATGSKADAADFGEEAGTAKGTDTVLSAREQDLLKGMLKSQLNGCWRPPGTGGGSEVPVVVLHWELNRDGSIAGEPRVASAPATAAGQVYTEAALRAVRMCSPFRLPPDKYEGGWRFIDWTFDPREML